ncbi:MAG: formate dehydrogenase accessory sulfurtransferase FdhD [Fusicatenibacter sp.]
MNIVEKYQGIDLYTKVQVLEADRSGIARYREDPVITEHLIDVYINERLVMKLTCTPSHLAELVLGRLLTEGMIKSAGDVGNIYICEYGRRARVFLRGFEKGENKPEQAAHIEITPSCCTGNHILDDYFVRPMKVEKIKSFVWKQEWIFKLMDVFEHDMPLHRKTGSTHSCYLMIDGDILFQCEDIGRHNALDKVIGYALCHSLDLKRAVVYTTGRIPTDMTVKAIRAGIPVLASRKKPTAEALLLADEYGLTLIGDANKNKMTIYGK